MFEKEPLRRVKTRLQVNLFLRVLIAGVHRQEKTDDGGIGPEFVLFHSLSPLPQKPAALVL